MKKAYWAGAALIAVFLVLGLTTFSSSMTPYVTFDEATRSPRVVQVMGGLEKGSSRYDTVSQTLHFNLVDPASKKVLPVAYRDVKPANFEEAVSIVAIGKYQQGGFQARASSPRPGRSTLTTSAPMSPRIWVHMGPATF